MLISHATTSLFCFISIAIVNVLALHGPGWLYLIMNGALVGRSFSGLIALYVTNKLNTMMATVVKLMILYVRFPFGIKWIPSPKRNPNIS